MTEFSLEIIAAVIFAVALLHTFSAPLFLRLAHRSKRHGGLLHLLGEVEVVFGFWAAVLLILMALVASGGSALAYAESRNYTEPAFVFVVMVIAASLPVLTFVMRVVEGAARLLPVKDRTAKTWLCLTMVPTGTESAKSQTSESEHRRRDCIDGISESRTPLPVSSPGWGLRAKVFRRPGLAGSAALIR